MSVVPARSEADGTPAAPPELDEAEGVPPRLIRMFTSCPKVSKPLPLCGLCCCAIIIFRRSPVPAPIPYAAPRPPVIGL